jgi:hypothetical protein
MSLLLRLLICCMGINHDLAMSTIRYLRIRLLIAVMVARIFIRLLRVLFLIVGLIIITTFSGTSSIVCIWRGAPTFFVRLLMMIRSWIASLIALMIVALVLLSLSVASVLCCSWYYRLYSSLYFLESRSMLGIVWFLVMLFCSLRLLILIVLMNLWRRFLLFFDLRNLFFCRYSKRLNLCDKFFPECHLV